jgi:AraC-like DNA-binding protein
MTANFAPSRYSYRDLPERDRAAIWWEVVGRKVFRAECQPLAAGPFHAEISHRALPGLSIVTVESSGQRLARTRELVAEGSDQLWLSITRAGALTFAQCGREAMVGEGEATLASYAEPLTLVRPSPGLSLGFLIPLATLAALVSNVEDALLRPIPRNTEALRLLIGYLNLLQDDHALVSAEMRHLVVSHVHDLVALAVGATRDAAVLADGRGGRAARLHAIKEDIIENLVRGDLTIDALARRHRLHPRYIQRLFETTGTTFSEFLLHQRLARAHRALVDPRNRDRNVSAIAFECGFGDLSYFNRCFRRFFGASPSHLRAEAERENAT